MSFWGELKRRNVFKVAIAYSVVAWLLAQIAQLSLESFAAPEWVIKSILLLLALGLPIALIFAWAFELTSEGVKREKDVDRSQSITRKTGRRIDYIIIGVLAIALVFAVSTHQWTTETTDTELDEPVFAEDARDKSIAVLPFVNMSGDPDNEYFSDGISEELLNVLVKVEGLRVASRTSSFAFKNNKEISIPDIAQSLNVDHVLEGSVRKAGDTVRITAQLIDVRTDSHLWSATYDRKLEDIFAIQDEIAGHIVDALKVALGTGEQDAIAATQNPTDNLDAYEDYLRGRYFWQRRGEDNIRKAIELFEQATAADPAFARAWSSLAAAHITMPAYSDDPVEGHRSLALSYAQKALSLDDTIAEVYAVLGDLVRGKRKWAEAEAHFSNAIKYGPKNSTSYLWYAELLQVAGRIDAALENALIAYKLDPLHPGTNQVLSTIYESHGDFENVEKFGSSAWELGLPGGLFELLDNRLRLGKFDEALVLGRELSAFLEEPSTFIELRIHAYRDPEQRNAFFDAIARNSLGLEPIDFLIDYVALDRMDEAFEIISSHAFGGNRLFALWRYSMAAFRQDPRFVEIVTEAGFVEYWQEFGWPNACSPVDGTVVCE